MLPFSEDRTLAAALRRIVPDAPPEMAAYVWARAAERPDLYRAGLALLEYRGFAALDAEGQDAVLRELEGVTSIALLVRHALEGFYTSTAGEAWVGFQVTA